MLSFKPVSPHIYVPSLSFHHSAHPVPRSPRKVEHYIYPVKRVDADLRLCFMPEDDGMRAKTNNSQIIIVSSNIEKARVHDSGASILIPAILLAHLRLPDIGVSLAAYRKTKLALSSYCRSTPLSHLRLPSLSVSFSTYRRTKLAPSSHRQSTLPAHFHCVSVQGLVGHIQEDRACCSHADILLQG